MTTLKESPSQTAGPYVHIGCTPHQAGLARRQTGAPLGTNMVTGNPRGQQITLDITVLDGTDQPVGDAMVEIWQAGPDGEFNSTEGFSNWGRQAADFNTGLVRFLTLKPGAVSGQAPHVLVWIAARGINLALTTRIYFPDEDNRIDPTTALAGERAHTLIAEATDAGYSHTVRLQGKNETVFFDV